MPTRRPSPTKSAHPDALPPNLFREKIAAAGPRPNGTIRMWYPNGDHWTSLPGMQTQFLDATADEVLAGGARGPGKSTAGRAKLIYGNPLLPLDHPLRASYLNFGKYRALVLRQNSTDLRDWRDQAESFYRPLGAVVQDDPPVIVFPAPNGTHERPKIYTDHLKDSGAIEKYKGWELHQILVEELTQIADESLYLKLHGCRRSTNPDILPQLLSTTNPDGPGAPWIKRRFVHVYSGGKLIPWGEVMQDSVTGLTRQFIPGRVQDNPHLLHNNNYIASLMAQPEHIRRAWLDGDWDAIAGQAFVDFRPKGPLAGEDAYPWARHVISANEVDLMPWYPRWIGMDWGYRHSSVIYWGCEHPDGRAYVYRELARSGAGAYELGVDIAKRSMLDLERMPEASMAMYISPETLGKRDASKTQAELIASGMSAVLGNGAVLLHAMNDDERAMKDNGQVHAAGQSLERRVLQLQGRAKINIVSAYNGREAGWEYIRELLRFKPALTAYDFDADRAREIFRRDGMLAYEQYIRNAQVNAKPEVLPKLRILDNCKLAIDALQSAIFDPDKKKREDVLKTAADTDDALDSLRYLLVSRKERPIVTPRSSFLAQRMQDQRDAGVNDMTLLHQVMDRAETEYDREYGVSGSGALRLGRASCRVQ